LRTTLFWTIKQRVVLIHLTDVSVQPIKPIFRVKNPRIIGFLTVEDWPDRFARNVRKDLPLLVA